MRTRKGHKEPTGKRFCLVNATLFRSAYLLALRVVCWFRVLSSLRVPSLRFMLRQPFVSVEQASFLTAEQACFLDITWPAAGTSAYVRSLI